MVKVAAVLLVGRWLDLYLMIQPSVGGVNPPFGLLEMGLLAVAWSASSRSSFSAGCWVWRPFR